MPVPINVWTAKEVTSAAKLAELLRPAREAITEAHLAERQRADGADGV